MGRGIKSLCGCVHISLLLSQFFACCFYISRLLADPRFVPHVVLSLLLLAILASHYTAWSRLPSAAYSAPGGELPRGRGGRWMRWLTHAAPHSWHSSSAAHLLRPRVSALSADSSDDAPSPTAEQLHHLYATPFAQHIAPFCDAGAGSADDDAEAATELVAADRPGRHLGAAAAASISSAEELAEAVASEAGSEAVAMIGRSAEGVTSDDDRLSLDSALFDSDASSLQEGGW